MRQVLTKLWPLALCVLVTLSCSLGGTSQNEDEGDRRSGPGSSSRSADARGSGLSGTTWKGTFKCDDGDEMQAHYKFADSGNPIYEYQTKSGAREVELTSPGQQIQFVPPGGGVTTIVIDDISVSTERASLTMTTSFEKASGETLDQNGARITSESVLSGDALDVETTIRSQNTVSQPGIVVPGNESTVVCRGKLKQ
ncbi:MAG: hypothetical protein M3R69_18985 [Acidobacteriota bacterium]|nr:hypothetical protein [Acidobacteriota bacterium]